MKFSSITIFLGNGKENSWLIASGKELIYNLLTQYFLQARILNGQSMG
jgi:hypothetical protein